MALYQAFISQIRLKATQIVHNTARSKGLLTRTPEFNIMPRYIKIDSEGNRKNFGQNIKG